MAGKIFQAPTFQGNFDTAFNRDSRSGPYEIFQGNNQFLSMSSPNVKTESNPSTDKKNSPERVGRYVAQNRKERNPKPG